MGTLILIGLVIWIAVMFAVGKSAEAKGRAPFWWVALAAFIGVFAFLPLVAVGSTEEQRLREVAEDEEVRQTVRSPAMQLRELAELKEAGLLTDEEFEAKRAALLERI
jgi:cytochrome c-type biogenesis protein CcmH/NrfG